MTNDLMTTELTGLLDNICKERSVIPSIVTQAATFHLDSVAHEGLKNTVHLLPTGFGSEVARHLRHIPVNPYNVTASELLKKSYVYNSETCTRSRDDQVLNASDFSLFSFMSDVINSAQKERGFSVDPKATDATIESLFSNCVHVIYGERGVGKTFFLNYALTRCNAVLDKRKTIWVRLNFVYTSGFEEDLEHWMHAQAAKIILRYYDTKSSYTGKKIVAAADHLFEWIKANERFNEIDRGRLRAALRSMEQVFGRDSEDEVLRPSLCDKEICRELYRFMRVQGWSFIFVLDGFDQLDINPDQVQRFDTIRSSVRRFISMRAAFGAAIVIVTRTNTFDDFKAYDPFKGIPDARKYRIGDVDFDLVVRKRFDAIKDVVIRKIPSHRRETAEKLEKTIENFLAKNFKKTLLPDQNEKINISNIRAKLQTLYLMFLEFANESTGKGYLIIEHMLLNGMRYPAVAYDYSEVSKDELTPQANEIGHEARFLPLITRYPLPKFRSSFVMPANATKHLLVGIRILQLSVACKNLQRDQEILSIGELTSILAKCFGYSGPIIVAAINELAAFDLLRIFRREALPASSPSNGILALPKAEYVLDECLYDVAYLNMCAMRTPFPTQYFGLELMRCTYLGNADRAAQAWVHSKIINALSLFSMLVFQNRYEKVLFSSRSSDELPEREKIILVQAIRNGMWELIPSVRNNLVVEVMQILTSGPRSWLSEEEREEIADKVRRMFHFWRQRLPAGSNNLGIKGRQ